MRPAMYLSAALPFAFAMLTSCGAPVSARANLTLELPVFGASDVLKLYAIDSLLDDNTAVNCAGLQNEQPPLDDPAVQILAETSARASDLESAALDLTLDKIPAGEDRIFAAEVRDSAGLRKGFGCTQGISIQANTQAEVSLTVTEL